MADQINYRSFFNFDDESELKKLRNTYKAIIKDYQEVISSAKKLKTEYKAAEKEMVQSSLKIASSFEKLNPAIQQDQQSIIAASQAAKDMGNSLDYLKGKVIALEGSERQLTKEKGKFIQKSNEAIRVDKEVARLKDKLAVATSKESQEMEKLRLKLSEANKERKKTAQEALGLVTIYQKESQRLNELRNQYKNLVLQQGHSVKQARALRQEITSLDARLKQTDAAVGQHQRSIGQYSNALRGAANAGRQLAGALGFTGLIFALVAVFRNAINIVKEYEKRNAELAGVLGKTRTETKALQDESARLGAVTQKTATQVTELQIAYARLGFSQQEIIAATPATINGSIALNSELADTATLVGAIVRTFNDLDAADAEEILDKITIVTQRSSNSFETLATSIPIAAGAANALNISFDEMLQHLGVIQDATQDASTSGTSLRMIYIKLAQSGLTLNEALDKISGSQNKLKTAVELFDARAAVSALAMANNRKRVEELGGAIDQAGGTMERVAKEQMDTLTGSFDLATSAWQGFVLSVEKGSGIISVALRGVVDSFTAFTTIVTAANDGTISWGKAIGSMVNPIAMATTMAELFGKQAADTAKQQEKSAMIAEKAQFIFDTATHRGIETMDDFLATENRIGAFFGGLKKEYANAAFSQEILNEVAAKYNKMLQDEADALGATTEEGEKKERVKTGLIEKYKEEIKLLQELKEQSKNQGEINQLNAAIAVRQTEINLIEKKAKRLEPLADLERKGLDPIIKMPELLEAPIRKTESRFDRMAARIAKSFKTISSQFFDIGLGLVQSAVDIFANLDERRNQDDEARIERMEEQKERELKNAGDNSDAREAIERRFDEQKKKIEQDQAKRARKIAIAQKLVTIAGIALDTSRAIIGALLPPPWGAGPIAGIPLGIAIGALGATQIAVAASTPLPAFKDGTLNAPSGAKIVGEKGREMWVEPSGKLGITGNKAEVRTDIPEGSAILTNAITENILRNPSRRIEDNEKASRSIQTKPDNGALLIRELKKGNVQLIQGFGNALDSRPVYQTTWTERGVTRRTKLKHTIINHINEEMTSGGEG